MVSLGWGGMGVGWRVLTIEMFRSLGVGGWYGFIMVLVSSEIFQLLEV